MPLHSKFDDSAAGFDLTDLDTVYEADKHAAHFYARLEAMKNELKLQLEARKLEIATTSINEPDSVDKAAHVTYLADISRKNDSDSLKMRQVDAALKRIDEGTYGICISSRDPIELARLHANPFALRTAEEQQKQERKLRLHGENSAIRQEL